MKHRKYRRFIYYIASTLILMTSCVSDEIISPPKGDENMITLSIPIPKEESTTQEIAESVENIIETLDILSFDENDNFDYHTVGRPADGNNTGTDIQYFNARVKSLNRRQTFIVIANARSEVDDFLRTYLGNESAGITKEELFKKLKRVHGDGVKWNVATTPYEKLPMWGESEPLILGNTLSSTVIVPVLRMVARIDVKLDNDISNLTIESIGIRNAKREGYIIPDGAKIGFEDGKIKAITASADAATLTHSTPIEYNFPSVRDISRTIYTFESAAAENHEAATCLIIGGKYGTDENTTYYRIDFFNADGKSYRDILRNHRYFVQITSVKGRGYTTEEEAFNCKSSNMSTDILEWDEEKMNHITLNDKYYLALNKNKWIFSREEHTPLNTNNKLTITTDFPGGWKASSSEDWLKLSRYESYSAGQEKISILPDENEIEEERIGYISITAGLLKHTIKITQNTSTDFGIEIIDDSGDPIKELTFWNDISAQTIFVRYSPATLSPIILKYPVLELIYNESHFEITEGPNSISGLKEYIIAPTQPLNNPTQPVGLNLEFEISYVGSHASDNVYIYQKERHAIFRTPLPEIYGWPYNNNNNYITIVANTAWTMTGSASGLFANISAGTPVSGIKNTIYELGANKILPLNGTSAETLTLTLTLNDGSNAFITGDIVIKPVLATLSSTNSTVEPDGLGDYMMAELITNLPISLYTAAAIAVTSDVEWVTGAEVEFSNDKLMLKTSYDKNTLNTDRVATITLDLGLNENLTYTLTQKLNPYIYLPEFGWIRREDSNDGTGNNWHYASMICNQTNDILPTRADMEAIYRAYNQLTLSQKDEFRFLDHDYWTNTRSTSWIPVFYEYYQTVNPTNGYASSYNWNNGSLKIRCIRQPLND